MAVVALSEHVQGALARERDQVAGRLEQLHEQSARLHALVEQLDRDLGETARLLQQMNEVLGDAPQLSLDGDLRGRELQRVAVDLLQREQSGDGAAGEPVHYRDWYTLLIDAGGRVAGKDPLATFLTQISRADEVESVRPRSGLYRLRSA
jgi:hypothetical protein